jgi:hypothetical protein
MQKNALRHCHDYQLAAIPALGWHLSKQVPSVLSG